MAQASLEAHLRVFDVVASISNLPSDFFDANQTRTLLRQGVLTKQIRGKPKTSQIRAFFLFSDVLLYCAGSGLNSANDASMSNELGYDLPMLPHSPSPRKSIALAPIDFLLATEETSSGVPSYQFKGRIYVKDILVSVEEENTRFFAIRRADERKIYTIKAQSIQDKQDWVAAFNKLSNETNATTVAPRADSVVCLSHEPLCAMWFGVNACYLIYSREAALSMLPQ
jgi:hypothetical protein